MPELRWTLLVVGVLFIVSLAVWERRRQHQATRFDAEQRPSGPSGSGLGTGERLPRGEPAMDLSYAELGSGREPALTLPEMRARESISAQELPIVEIDEDAVPVLGVGNPGPSSSEPSAWRSPTAEPPATPSVKPDKPVERLAALESGEPESHEPLLADEPVVGAAAVRVDTEEVELDPQQMTAEAASVDATAGFDGESFTAASEDIDDAALDAAMGHPSGRSVVLPELHPPTEPVVDWPAEDQRRIIAIRLVAPPMTRFAGRAVRQALAAEGFVLGKFGIFHKGDDSGKALLSAASLNKPGTFDLDTLDTQRFGGLNLFAVLPGPQPAPQAYNELLRTSWNLNERLEGALQDERGNPLTTALITSVRDSLIAEVPQ